MSKSKKIPFEFVLEELYPLSPRTMPMFGCTAVYVRERIVLILRDREDHREDNGVWLATTVEHHDSLRPLFPHMRSLQLFDTPVTGWQNLPSSSPDFEKSVSLACELIKKNDPRIGKIPASKKKKAPKKRKAKVKKKV